MGYKKKTVCITTYRNGRPPEDKHKIKKCLTKIKNWIKIKIKEKI